MLDTILASLTTHVTQIERTLCETWWHDNRPAGDPFTRLYWLFDGEGFVYHHDEEYHMRPGILYIIPAHVPFHYHCPERMDLYWLHFTAHVMGSLDLFAFLRCAYAVTPSSGERVQSLWNAALAADKQHLPGSVLEVDGALRQMLAPFLGTVDTLAQQARVLALTRFQDVLTYIDERLAHKMTLIELADIAMLHPTYFSNLFSRHMGESPLGYVNRRRVERAQRLLWENDEPLSKIAQQVGFADVFYFSRIFKRFTGTSPTQFRARVTRRRP